MYKKSYIVGGATECDLVIDNATVSGTHLKFTPLGNDRFVIEDLKSTNGTFVNNVAIQYKEIGLEDIIQLGLYSIAVKQIAFKLGLLNVVAPTPSRKKPVNPEGTRYLRCQCGAVAAVGSQCPTCGIMVSR